MTADEWAERMVEHLRRAAAGMQGWWARTDDPYVRQVKALWALLGPDEAEEVPEEG